MNIRIVTNLILSLFFLALILSGVYYSVILTQNFEKKSTADKALGTIITIMTIVAGLIYIYYYIIPNVLGKTSSRVSSVSPVPSSIPPSFNPSLQEVPLESIKPLGG